MSLSAGIDEKTTRKDELRRGPKILCDAPASAEDSIPRFADKQGFGIEVVKLEDKGYWEIYIQKK